MSNKYNSLNGTLPTASDLRYGAHVPKSTLRSGSRSSLYRAAPFREFRRLFLKQYTCWILLGMCFTFPVYASALQKMFDSLGGSQSNYSTPGAYHDQAAGYYTGGGFVMRQRSHTVAPIQISLPHIGAGCGGIDAYFGSMSFMNADQMAQMGRNILASAPTYAIQLGLKTLSPEIENLFSSLRKIALDMNALMLNECQMTQQLFAATMPQGSALEEHACKDVAAASDGGDWFGAREKCKTSEDIKNRTRSLKERPQNQDLLVGAYNLVWHVLKKQGTSDELAHFIMSVVGTVVSREEGDKFRLHYIEGKGDTKEFLDAFLKGGQTVQLSCGGDNKCLNPRWVPLVIPVDGTMKHKVSSKISSISTKYLSGNAPFSPQERDFLNDTVNLPVYKYIQVSAAARTPFIMGEAMDYIAISILLNQFDKAHSDILEGIEKLATVQMDTAVIETFKQKMQMTRMRLQGLMSLASTDAIGKLNQLIQSVEKTILSQES